MNHYVDFNDDLSSIVESTDNEFLKEVFKYENFRKTLLEKKVIPTTEVYLNQVNIFRKTINKGFEEVLKLKIAATQHTLIFSSQFYLHHILSPHKLVIKDIDHTILKNSYKSEDTYYYCMRNSLFKNLDIIEYSLEGFGNLLIDIYDYNKEIELFDLYSLVKNQFDENEINTINEVFINFLYENIVKNYSLNIIY